MTVSIGQNFKILPPPGTAYEVPYVAGTNYFLEAHVRMTALPATTKSILVVGFVVWTPTTSYGLSNFIAVSISPTGMVGGFSSGFGAITAHGPIHLAPRTDFADWFWFQLGFRWRAPGVTPWARLVFYNPHEGGVIDPITGLPYDQTIEQQRPGVGAIGVDGIPGRKVGIFTDAAYTLSGGWPSGDDFVEFDDIYIYTSTDEVGPELGDPIVYEERFNGADADSVAADPKIVHPDWPDQYLIVPGGVPSLPPFQGALRIGRLVGPPKLGTPISGVRILDKVS